MQYDFTKLPTSAPSNVVPAGKYLFTVEDADVRTSKVKGTPYLNTRLSLYDANRKKVGSIFDAFYDSDKELPLFKLQRFVRALQLPITGVFTFDDLVKLIKGKEGIVDIIAKVDTYDDVEKNYVKSFGTDIYYRTDDDVQLVHMSEAEAEADVAPVTNLPFEDGETPEY